jgi:hypothetical protein
MDSTLKKVRICYAIYLTMNFFGLVYGMDSQEVKNTNEKRSCIQVVDGYAFLSENMTLAETREAAFINAKRQALEMAQTFIQSKSTVQNLEIVSDRIDASSEGAVTIIEQKDLGVENNTRYHVWIKAEVQYGIKPSKGKFTQNDYSKEESPLTVKVWASKDRYKKGENIEIFIQGNKDFYARVVDISSDGSIIQLLPNDFRQDSLFKADRTYKIPDENDKFNLTVTPPYGADKIVVYASAVPLGSVPMESLGNGLHRYEGTTKSLAMKSRGLKITPINNQNSLIADFYETECIITTGE